ncbi:hypothetical protein BCR43DRAFT_70207 [Syncephalastrum racemosum]|uniref:Uncharacterized protein n=1 Tax=Syncephalastrum racemosum TaxID=13706 RepID=A0A1X2HWL3_SYNRA|nr:hypothetical protein BCR43DRAFT_70207 [Syncephalastrum racemosum]
MYAKCGYVCTCMDVYALVNQRTVGPVNESQAIRVPKIKIVSYFLLFFFGFGLSHTGPLAGAYYKLLKKIKKELACTEIKKSRHTHTITVLLTFHG